MMTLNNINNNLTSVAYPATPKGDSNRVNKELSSYSTDTLELSSQTDSNTSLSNIYNNTGELVHKIGDMADTAINVSETVLDTSKNVMDIVSNTYNSLYNTEKDTVDVINNTLKLSSESYNNLKGNLTIMKDSAVNIASTITFTAGKIASNLSKIATTAVTTYGAVKAINNQSGSFISKGVKSAYAVYNGASTIWSSIKDMHTSLSEGYDNVSKDYATLTNATKASVTSALELKNTLQAGAGLVYQNGINMTDTAKTGATDIYNAISNGYVAINNQLSSNKSIAINSINQPLLNGNEAFI